MDQKRDFDIINIISILSRDLNMKMKNKGFFLVGVILGSLLTFLLINIFFEKRNDDNIALVKNSFKIFNAKDVVEAIAKYHSKDYIQYSDGKVLNYNDLIEHAKYIQSVLASPIEIIYDNVIAQNDTVCTIHRAKAQKINGELVEIKVIALHKIQNNKIVSTDELTCVIKGDDSDKEMGSKH